jgi:vitamin B12 transporter
VNRSGDKVGVVAGHGSAIPQSKAFAPLPDREKAVLKSFLRSSIALAALVPLAAHAQTLDDEKIIVSATRIPTPQAQVGSSYTVITAADIQARQLGDLPDILRAVPGLDIVQSGGTGGQTSLFMRGTNANHTKVLLDGIDMSDPSNPNGSVDLGKLPAGDIARVEVLRGPQSGLYGSDALGGVVSIVTKSGEGPAKFNASLEGGSFDTFNQFASVGGSDEDLHVFAALQHAHVGATPVTPQDLLLPGEKRNDDFYDNLTASTRLGYDVADNFDLGFVGRYSDSRSRITGDAFDPATFTSYPSPSQTHVDVLQYESRLTAHLKMGGLEQTLGLAYGSTVTEDLDPDNGPLPSSGDRVKLDWQGDVALGVATLVLGAQTARDMIHVPMSAGITTNAGYAELQSVWGPFAGSISLREDDNSRYGNKLTWRAAPVWTIAATGTRLKASIGTGFKAPSLEQLFQDFPAYGFLANPDLKPETSTGYDVGVEQRLGVALSAGATFFHNDIRDLIANNATFTTDINIGKAMTQGVESYIVYKPTDTLSLRVDYTYTDAIDRTAHRELIRRPRNKASLDADWQALPDVSLDARLLYVGPQIDGNRDFSIPRLKMPGYTLVDLAASYRLDSRFTLFGRIENALDTRYQSPDGFLRPGIGAFGGIRASFE